MQKLSITGAAREFGCARDTLARVLKARGHDVKRGATFTISEAHLALAGDLKHERTRLTRANADLQEEELRRKRGETMLVEEAKSVVTKLMSCVRQRLISQPTRLGARTNPTDPLFATRALEVERTEALKEISEQAIAISFDEVTQPPSP